MQTQPPFLRNTNLPWWGANWQPAPGVQAENIYTGQIQTYWNDFCDLATAQDMLAAAKVIAPDVVLIDILDTSKPLPPGVGRYPYQLMPMGVVGSISCYILFGHVPLKDGSGSATLYESAAYLADTKAGEYYELEAQYTNLTGSNNRVVLYPYVSNWDTADSDCYWGDPLKGPALPSLA